MSVPQHTNVCDCSQASGHSALCLLQCSGSGKSDLVAGEITQSAYPYSLCSLSPNAVMSRPYGGCTAVVCWKQAHIVAATSYGHDNRVCQSLST
jgi:hypothetical protein